MWNQHVLPHLFFNLTGVCIIVTSGLSTGSEEGQIGSFYGLWSKLICSTFLSKDVTWTWICPQVCMGVCLRQGVTEESKKAKLQSSKIEQELCEHARAEMNVVKILMLGRCIPSMPPFLFPFLIRCHQFWTGLCQDLRKVAKAPW